MNYLAQLKIPGGDVENPTGTPLAVPTPSNLPAGVSGGLSDAAPKLFQLGIEYIMILGFIAGFVYAIYSGIRYITSGGDPNKIADARKGLLFSLIGLAVIAGAFFILNAVAVLFGVKLYYFTSP